MIGRVKLASDRIYEERIEKVLRQDMKVAENMDRGRPKGTG
jgi:hypothetical protein